MKTVVIFGGAGFVGRNIVRRMAKKGYKIFIPYQKITDEAKLRLFGDVGQILPFKFDTLDNKNIRKIIEQAEIIINLRTIWLERKNTNFKNYIYNFNKKLVDTINSYKNEKILIFFSGIGVNHGSHSLRIRSIAKSEDYILENAKKSIIIRPGIIIGNGDPFISKLISLINFPSFFLPLIGSGKTKIQPVYIENVAEACEKIISKKIIENQIYELVGNEIFTYETLYNYILQCLYVKRILIRIPFFIAKIIVFFSNLI